VHADCAVLINDEDQLSHLWVSVRQLEGKPEAINITCFPHLMEVKEHCWLVGIATNASVSPSTALPTAKI
jgi:hypothetical protein